jgi:hypothetical protein
MCSIEEAWAGQNFETNKVVSQGDMRLAYMNIPNNLMEMPNEFSIDKTNDPSSRYLSRGINSKYSREPRVPNMDKVMTDGSNIQLSSAMSDESKYMGLEPRPSYMQVYDQADGIMASPSSKDNFNDLQHAFKVSDTVNNFMNVKDNNHNVLLKEDNDEDKEIIALKYKNSNQGKQHQLEKQSKSNEDIQLLLVKMMKKLDTIETKLHNGNKNSCDMILYVLIGMLISFLLYSIVNSLSKK